MSQVQSGIGKRQVADASPRVVHPPINIESIKSTDGLDTIDLCRLTVPVPGFTMKEINLKVIDGCLDIRAEKLSPDAQDEEALKFSWCVPNYTLKRVVSLPNGTLPNQVRASLDKAIVTVTYPRYAKPWDVPLETPGSEPFPPLLTQGEEPEGPTATNSDNNANAESFKFDDASRIERRASV
ncbi:hypothetical protein ONZ45_g16320 [Pleurotus djamor]|nr:hypothetical protein ONZ45_g16320 [Pleurotus djamor]